MDGTLPHPPHRPELVARGLDSRPMLGRSESLARETSSGLTLEERRRDLGWGRQSCVSCSQTKQGCRWGASGASVARGGDKEEETSFWFSRPCFQHRETRLRACLWPSSELPFDDPGF